MRGPGPAARKRIVFATAAIVAAVSLPTLTLLGVDVYLHRKYEQGVLVNVWGYRGRVAGRKRRGDYRVAVLGGSAAFGFGVKWEESMPALLERKLAARAPAMTVVNLAFNGEGVYSFPFTMEDYAYLQYDLVCLYEGYNDLFGGPNHSVFRHESPLFRLTGYLPIFPIVFREKASVMLYGDTRAVYDAAKTVQTVFRPGLATKTTAEILRSAAEVGDSLERQLGRVSAQPRRRPAAAGTSGCGGPYAEYCQLMYDAVRWARDHHKQALVVTQPYALGSELRAAHAAQQEEMATMLERQFGRDARVRYVNLGDVVDLADPLLSFDRMHLTAAGNERIASRLVQPIVEMAALQ